MSGSPRPLVEALGGDTGDILRRYETLLLHERVIVLRGVIFPFWRRTVRLRGIEHVHAGLAAGNGVMLWINPCLRSSLSVKQALFDAGYPLAHLTRPGHGFSSQPIRSAAS